jgi:hypothetical protein
MRAPGTRFAPICAIIIATLHSQCSSAQVPRQSTESPEERIKKLVVMIQGKFADTDTIGAGITFGFGADRLYIVTANHVVRRGSQEIQNLRVELKWLPGEPVAATLLSQMDPNLDLAVLAVKGLSQLGLTRDTPRFDQLGDPTALQRQDAAHTLGYPNGNAWEMPVTEDRIVQASGDSIKFQSAFLYPGNSGGALLNGKFELVGLVRKDEPPHGEAANFDLVIQKLRDWGYPVSLRRARASAAPVPTQTTESPGAVIGRIVGGRTEKACTPGYVWREAFPGDHVCVTPESRAQAARDNAGPYHAEPCRPGYVWRDAGPSDHICVPVARRSEVAEENRLAAER